MAENEVSSGFIDADVQSGEQSFSNLTEVYVSVSGYARLFRCQRYNRLHILKALKPEYIGSDFYEQALRKEFDIGYHLYVSFERYKFSRTLARFTVFSFQGFIEYITYKRTLAGTVRPDQPHDIAFGERKSNVVKLKTVERF